MTGELQLRQPAGLALPPVPWRDPYTVSPGKLAEYIGMLEKACQENPRSADLRTCLGMAHAMNFDVYKSEDALEAALALEPENFFARLKYAELFYRLRALVRAEGEALKAVEAAGSAFELALSRKLLLEIRTLARNGTQKPEWTKSLTAPSLCLLAIFIAFSLLVILK